jgi:hypothetical protein
MALLAASALQDSRPIVFEDVTDVVGLSFRHRAGGWGRRHLPETMGAGGAWLDFDVDGDQDIYLVQSGLLPGTPDEDRAPDLEGAVNVLFRNDGTGSFTDLPGIAADPGYGRGASVADFDNDGFPDLFVGNWGRDTLYRNNGDGTFTDVTVEAGLGDRRLASSSSWGDLDGDGWLDLYVVTYVHYDIAAAPYCKDPAYDDYDFCHPTVYDGQHDILYRNEGDGTFTDHSEDLEGLLSIEGMGLAVGIADLTGDHEPDIYVANDTTANFAHINQGGFRFMESGIISGLGVGHDGRPQAGMGIAIGDIDGDLMPDVAVTNFENEPYNLYRPIDIGFYVEDSFVAGFGQATQLYLGYGVVMQDFDLDGDLDLSVANGHTQQLSPVYRQPNQLFTNQLTSLRVDAIARGELSPTGTGAGVGPAWRPSELLLKETSEAAGAGLTAARSSRGMAEGDFDRDGRLDLLITNVDDRPTLLRNVSETDANALVLRLRGTAGNRDALGAYVTVTPCSGPDDCEIRPGSGVVGFPQVRELQGSSSYVIQHARDLHFGLGSAAGARLRVRWRDGAQLDLGYQPAGLLLVQEGFGRVSHRPQGAGPGPQR